MANNYKTQDPFSFFNAANNQIDYKKFSDMQQKTINTLTEANKVLFDSLQKFVKSQSDFFQDQAQVAANVATTVMSNTTPEENIDTHTRFAQHYFDTNAQNMQNVAKAASDTAVKVFDIVNKQAVENLNEISKMNKKAANAN